MSEHPVFDSKLSRVAIAVVLGSSMSILDTTIVYVAAPTIGRQFHASLVAIQWIGTSYTIALAVVIPMTRWVIDRFGAKRAWMICLTLFTIGSALSGASWSLSALIVFRVLQGLGGGMIIPIGQAVLSRAAGPARMGRVMTIVGIPNFVMPALGPTFGGLILERLSWHWLFYINVPIGVAAWFVATRYLEETERNRGERLDWLGALLLPSGLASIIYGVTTFGNAGTLSIAAAVSVLAGLALVCLAIVHALRTPKPIFDVRLWKRRGFAIANAAGFFFGFVGGGIFPLSALYFQIGRGYSPLIAGMLQSPPSVVAIFILPVAGSITDRVGARRIVPLGTVVLMASLFIFSHLQANTTLLLLEFSLVLRGFGLAATSTPAMASGYAQLDPSQLNSGSTIANIIQRLSGALGIAVLTTVLQRRVEAEVPGHPRSISQLAIHGHAHALIAPGLATAFSQTYLISALMLVLALIPALSLYRAPTVDPADGLVEVG